MTDSVEEPDFYEDFERLIGPIIKADVEGARAGWAALANVGWRHRSEPNRDENYRGPSFRAAAGEIAEIRDDGSHYMDWYCSARDGVVREDIARLMAAAGWFYRIKA